ncbi:hypothetical protein CB1_000765116, partial [Camelus ferus]
MEILLIIRFCCNCTYALLYKPIDRVTRSTLVLHDLLKHTPVDHPDYPLLQDALRISQNFLSSINEDIDPRRTAVTTPKGEAPLPYALRFPNPDPSFPAKERPSGPGLTTLSPTRQLVKDGFLVEVSESSRKLRHVFLFTDVLLCAKLKKTSAGKHQQYDCKWYIPLADLVFPSPEESEASPQVHPFPDHELEDMKMKISALKSEIQKEKANKGQSRAIERLKKKMFENEFLLLLNSPTIPFRIHNRNGKVRKDGDGTETAPCLSPGLPTLWLLALTWENQGLKPPVPEEAAMVLALDSFSLLLWSQCPLLAITGTATPSYLFLLSSDYERSEWREAIQKLQKKDLQAFVLSSVELQVLTGSCFKLRTVHNIPVTSNKDDDESPGLYGFLHVIVHSAKGFKQSANLYCTLEVDSFGYFVSKAKTRVFRDTTEPKWDEGPSAPPLTLAKEFEIELEGSQSLRILCYEKCYDKTKVNKDNNEIVDKIMGKGQIQAFIGESPSRGEGPGMAGGLEKELGGRGEFPPLRPALWAALGSSPSDPRSALRGGQPRSAERIKSREQGPFVALTPHLHSTTVLLPALVPSYAGTIHAALLWGCKGTRLAEPCWPQLLSEPLCAEAAVCARQCGAISCLYPLLATAEASRHKPKAHCPFPDLEVGKKVTQQVPGSVPARILLVYLPLWAGAWQLDPQTVETKNWHTDVIEMNGPSPFPLSSARILPAPTLQIKVEFSMKFTSRDMSLKRTPSKKQTGVFGVKISVVTKRERSKVPYIVRQCVEEVEKRGIEEVGIYRISGVATDIQALKAVFDANNKDILLMLSDMDINAIAGTLKLYFRELPEPLLTDRLYPAFMEGIALSDPAAKENCMMHLLRSLPDPNLITFLFLLEHLK